MELDRSHRTTALAGLGACREQAVLGEKFDHEAIEQPGLLDLAGVAGSWQNLQLAIGYARHEREGALMAAVLAAGENDRRAGDALVILFSNPRDTLDRPFA